MAQHEISSTQVRTLLLLLVLGPLVAAILLVSFLAEFAGAQRQDALQQMRLVYQQSLLLASSAFERQLQAGTIHYASPSLADTTFRYFRDFFSASVLVRVRDEKTGRELVTSHGAGEVVGSTRLPIGDELVYVELLVPPDSPELHGARMETQFYVWIAVLAVGINLVIAGVAAWVVSRQLRIHELRGSTLATVAHELRTPLASMRLLLETLVAGRFRDPSQAKEYLELAFRENERLSRLVERFLTFSRVKGRSLVVRKSAVAPYRLVSKALDAIGLNKDAPILQVHVAEELPPIEADEDALVMALVNLIENAVKYTGDEKRITVAAERIDKFVEFSVSDNGIGIPRRQLKAIFGEFHQVDQRLSRSAEGCGLGLSIVKSLVQAHNGKIRVESVEGRGSTFTFSIPVA